MKKAKNSVDSLVASFGQIFLPIINKAADGLSTVVGWFNKLHQTQKDAISTVGSVAAGYAVFAGGLLYLAATVIPRLKTAWLSFNAVFLSNPIGLAATAAAGLAAAAFIVAQNWESITNPVAASARKITETLKAELEKQKAAQLESVATQRAALQKEYDDRKKAIQDEYGDLKDVAFNKQQFARDAAEAGKRALDDELNAARRVHDEKITMLEQEYDQKIRTLNAEADAQIKAIQDQIDAIDKQTETEDRALKHQRDLDRLAELQKAYQEAKTGEESVRALKDLNDFKAQMARDALLDQRDDEKDSLRAQIDQIRANTRKQEDVYRDELAAKKKHEDDMLTAVDDRINGPGGEKEKLDTALTAELTRIQTEGQAKLTMLTQELVDRQTALAAEEQALKDSYARQEADAAEHAKRMAAAMAGSTSTGAGGSTIVQPLPPIVPIVPPSVEGWANGGMIEEPSLITRLRDRKPIAVAGEAGPEPVGLRGININVNTMNVRKENDIREIAQQLVSLIRLQTGLRI